MIMIVLLGISLRVSTVYSRETEPKNVTSNQLNFELFQDSSDTQPRLPLSNDISILESDDYIYSASKQLEALRTAPNAMSVISATHLKSLSGMYIPQVLRMFPGVDVIQLSRNEYTVGLRGFINRSFFRIRDLLVLIDNRTIYDDFSGNIEWETIDLFPQDIAKIEIIRGASSAIHGANGSRGVINIISKPPISVPPFEINSTFLKDGFREQFAGSFYDETYALKISGGYENIDLYNRFKKEIINGERRTKIWRINSAITKKLSNRGEILFSGGTNTGTLLQHTTSGFLVENQQATTHLQIEYEHPDLSIRTFWNYRDLTVIGPESGRILTTRIQQMIDFEIIKRYHKTGKNNLTLGANIRRTTADSTSTSGKVEQNTIGLFIDDKYNISNSLLVQFAIRLDEQDQAGTLISPRFGISYLLSPKHTLKTSINVGYRNPTLSNNFFNADFGPIKILGNKELNPEKSTWYEIGYIGQNGNNLKGGLDLFHVQMKNIIEPTENGNNISFRNNPDIIKGYGGELWGQYSLSSKLQIISNYNLTYYEKDSKKLQGTIPHKVNLGLLFHNWNSFTGALTYHYVYSTVVPFFIGGKGGAESTINRYNTLNLILGYQITKSARIRFDAMNITNDKRRELEPIGEELSAEFRFTFTLVY